MSALQNVKGTWGIGGVNLPDFGLTEYLRMLQGKTQSAEQQTTYNNPAVVKAVGGSFTPTQAVSSYTAPKTTTPIIDPVTKQIVQAPAGGDTGGGTVTQNPGDLESQAQADRQMKIDRAIGRFNVIKDAATNLKNSATGIYDRTAGELEANYGKLKEFGKEKLGQAMEGLGQADLGVQNTYGRVIGNAQRAMESGIMKNRVLARAMGLGGSSNYLYSQGDTRNAGMNATNDANFEKAQKLSAIGTQKSATTTDFAQNELALEAEKTKFLGDAMDKRDTAYRDADFMEKNFGVDSAAAMADADNEFTSALDQIRTYNLENKVDTSGNTTAGTFAKTYNAFAPIQSTLDNTSGQDSAKTAIAKIAAISPMGTTTAGGVGGGGGMADASALFNIKKKVNTQADPYGYYQNVA